MFKLMRDGHAATHPECRAVQEGQDACSGSRRVDHSCSDHLLNHCALDRALPQWAEMRGVQRPPARTVLAIHWPAAGVVCVPHGRQVLAARGMPRDGASFPCCRQQACLQEEDCSQKRGHPRLHSPQRGRCSHGCNAATAMHACSHKFLKYIINFYYLGIRILQCNTLLELCSVPALNLVTLYAIWDSGVHFTIRRPKLSIRRPTLTGKICMGIKFAGTSQVVPHIL